MTDKQTWPDLCGQLIQRRIDLGVNRWSVGCIISKHGSSMQAWENLINVPNATNFIAWADALNMDVKLVPREK